MSLYYRYPCKTRNVSDDFADHVARKSLLPGIDFTCPIGEQVIATTRGVVIEADNNPIQTKGKHIIIKHGDGNTSEYLHLSVLDIRVGQKVAGGEVIALSGNTSAGNSTGPHLHFTLKDKNGKCFDPAPLLRKNWLEFLKKQREAKKAAKAAAKAGA